MRSPATLFLSIALLTGSAARSQSNELMIQGKTGKLYLVHTVEAKENWYSIGRLYNEPPKMITVFNKLSMDKPLEIGQHVEIPLTAVNFSQTGQKAAGETLVPIYHEVQEKEWMYRISIDHDKVPIANLEKWNHIKKDQVKAGMHLIVGYLKVKTALSALAKGPAAAPLASTLPPASSNPSASTASSSTSRSSPTPPVTDATAVKPTPKKADSMPVASSVPAKPAPALTTPVSSPAASSLTSPVTSMQANAPATALHYNGGFFRADFNDGGKSTAGVAGTFKSSSGWQDGKYYALMNNVPVGTIIKVTDEATSKSIFAKVLGQLPDMKESAGLAVRISNAAASELGATEGRFSVEMKY